MSDFVLRHLVRDALRDTDNADPGVIAEVVLKRIPRQHVRAALSQALRLYVRQVISEVRVGGNASAPAQFNTSAKVVAIRDGWQRRLRDRVHVGKGEWKFLADCTYDDLLAASAERRLLADRNLAWARTYNSWAALLTEFDVSTFGELPPDAQAAALGRAA